MPEPGKLLVGTALYFTMGAINAFAEQEGSVELKKLEKSKEEEWIEAKLMGSDAEGIDSALPSWLATEHEFNEKDFGEASRPTNSENVKVADGEEDENIAKLRKRLARLMTLGRSQSV